MCFAEVRTRATSDAGVLAVQSWGAIVHAPGSGTIDGGVDGSEGFDENDCTFIPPDTNAGFSAMSWTIGVTGSTKDATATGATADSSDVPTPFALLALEVLFGPSEPPPPSGLYGWGILTGGTA